MGVGFERTMHTPVHTWDGEPSAKVDMCHASLSDRLQLVTSRRRPRCGKGVLRTMSPWNSRSR